MGEKTFKLDFLQYRKAEKIFERWAESVGKNERTTTYVLSPGVRVVLRGDKTMTLDNLTDSAEEEVFRYIGGRRRYHLQSQ